MAKHIEIGKRGEDLSAAFLRDKGYIIIERNWRHLKLEVDIIASKDNLLIFIEVKTREKDAGLPEHAVTTAKENLLAKAANEYIYQTNYEGEIRFDIIAVTMLPQLYIHHIEDAFFPGW
jgi:putative endonuclease